MWLWLHGPSRSECRSDCSVAKVADGDQPIHLRSVQQGFPEGPEPAAAPARAQLAVEAAAEKQGRGGEEEGVRLSREDLCAPRPLQSPGRPHRNKKALQQKAR